MRYEHLSVHSCYKDIEQDVLKTFKCGKNHTVFKDRKMIHLPVWKVHNIEKLNQWRAGSYSLKMLSSKFH